VIDAVPSFAFRKRNKGAVSLLAFGHAYTPLYSIPSFREAKGRFVFQTVCAHLVDKFVMAFNYCIFRPICCIWVLCPIVKDCMLFKNPILVLRLHLHVFLSFFLF
jgi:hypothetical protein